MACNCKQEEIFANYNAKIDKMMGRKKTFKDYLDNVKEFFLSLLLRLFAIIAVLILCPFIIVFITFKTIWGKELTIRLPKVMVNYLRKNINNENVQ